MTALCLENKYKILRSQAKPSKIGPQVSYPTTLKPKLRTLNNTELLEIPPNIIHMVFQIPMSLLRPVLDLFAFTWTPFSNHSLRHCKWHILHDLLPTPNS